MTNFFKKHKSYVLVTAFTRILEIRKGPQKLAHLPNTGKLESSPVLKPPFNATHLGNSEAHLLWNIVEVFRCKETKPSIKLIRINNYVSCLDLFLLQLTLELGMLCTLDMPCCKGRLNLHHFFHQGWFILQYLHCCVIHLSGFN